MPEQTPKSLLIDRVEARLLRQGLVRNSARSTALLAVESFYLENRENPYYELVSEQAIQIMIEVMPSSVTYMRSAFESLARQMRVEGPRFDASGIPVNERTADPFEDVDRIEPTASERLLVYPEDRITGAPHHYIVNGVHDGACGCGGHLTTCETWGDPTNRHAASICGITRTLCRHRPKHRYRELCEHDGFSIDTLAATEDNG